MAIPISPDVTKVYEDTEGGISYHFRYITGRTADAFYALTQKALNVDAFIPKAEEQIRKQDRRWKKGERQTAVRNLAAQMASEAQSEENFITHARQVIDLLLVKWEGKNAPKEFPENPSEWLQQGLIIQLYEFIGENLPELSGLSVEDSKN